VDPIAHTLTGAAFAAAGLKRATPLATAALVIGANLPDVDVVMNFAGEYAALAHRRGWTHGVLALVVLPLVLAGSLLAYDRAVRRRRGLAPVRAGPLLALSALAVVTHPFLDWLNNYGLRWLMPFDGRWFYGDALFIIDPWVWLGLGGVMCLAHSRSIGWIVAWAAFAALGTALMLTTPEVPTLARALWIAGVVAVAALRSSGITVQTKPRAIEHAARAALVLLAVYSGGAALANLPAKEIVRTTLEASGVDSIEAIMIGPKPADPFAADVVIETPHAYYVGNWHWLATPKFVPTLEPIPRGEGPIVDAASRTLEARRYLSWSRFPFFEVEAHGDGYLVRIRDMRYRDREGRVGGLVVRLDSELRPVGPPSPSRASH